MARNNHPRVLIATPTPGTVKTAYMKSVIATIRDLARRGIESDFDTWEGSDIASQRNVLASRFLRRDGFTHLLFVDSDMVVPSDLCARMIAATKPVIGAVYAAKTLLFGEVEQALRDGAELKDAMLAGSNWHLWQTSKPGLPDKAICPGEALPLGAVLIQRALRARMVTKGVSKEDKAPGQAGGSRYNFFGARAEDAVS